ncbi:MAG: hypothetical protein K2X01_10295 [Cyanobacteria bacterium]|nr:hypothetical protein [Cyanobacteriota bacterium]
MQIQKQPGTTGTNFLNTQPPHQTIQFGSTQPLRFGAGEVRPPSRGIFALLGRLWRYAMGNAHEAQTAREQANPQAALTAAHDQIVADYQNAESALNTIVAERNLFRKQLEAAAQLEAKEKKEALAAAAALKGLAETDPDYKAQKEYAEHQVTEWKAAQADLTTKQSRMADYDVRAEEAQGRKEEFKTKVDQALAAISAAKAQHADNKTKANLVRIQQQLDAAAGKSVAFSDDTASLLQSIALEGEKLDVALTGGRSLEERTAAMRAKKRAQATQTSDALNELLAQVGGGNTQSSSTTDGGGIGADVKK